jgi:hypothetical protein
MGKEEHPEKQTEEQELDPFGALLEEEPEADPTPDESEEEAAGEEEAAAAEAPEGAGEEDEPEAGAGSDEGEPAGTEEEPEPVTLEESEERQTNLEKENFALRRDLMKLKERDRIRKEEARLAAIERESAEDSEEELGSVNEEGKVVLNREVLDKALARVQARRASAAPAQDYKSFKEETIAGYEDKEAATAAADELEQAYQFLDQEFGRFCQEAEINPNQIGGVANTLSIIEESGIAKEFEEKYPGVSIPNLMLAPNSQPIMRKEFEQHLQRRMSSKSSEEEGKPVVKRPKIGAKPRPMSRKGKTRVAAGGAKLTDVDPADIFDMKEDEFAELERNSAADLERRA